MSLATINLLRKLETPQRKHPIDYSKIKISLATFDPDPYREGTGTFLSKTKPLSFKSYKKHTPQPPDKKRDKLSQEGIIANILFRNP
jgi:hypothetical protein